jgi:hypothetical protein
MGYVCPNLNAINKYIKPIFRKIFAYSLMFMADVTVSESERPSIDN